MRNNNKKKEEKKQSIVENVLWSVGFCFLEKKWITKNDDCCCFPPSQCSTGVNMTTVSLLLTTIANGFIFYVIVQHLKSSCHFLCISSAKTEHFSIESIKNTHYLAIAYMEIVTELSSCLLHLWFSIHKQFPYNTFNILKAFYSSIWHFIEQIHFIYTPIYFSCSLIRLCVHVFEKNHFNNNNNNLSSNV